MADSQVVPSVLRSGIFQRAPRTGKLVYDATGAPVLSRAFAQFVTRAVVTEILTAEQDVLVAMLLEDLGSDEKFAFIEPLLALAPEGRQIPSSEASDLMPGGTQAGQDHSLDVGLVVSQVAQLRNLIEELQGQLALQPGPVVTTAQSGKPGGYAAINADGDVDLAAVPARGVILTNAAGTVTKRVRLNDAGDGLIYENV